MQSAEVEDAYRRASEIGERLGTTPPSFKAKWGLWLNANSGARRRWRATGPSELVTLAQRSGDGDLLLEAYHCRWSTAFFRGDVAGALADGRIGVETYDMARHRHLGARVRRPRSGRLRACAWRPLALQMSGDGEGGRKIARARDRACRKARPSQQPRSCAAQCRHRSSACRRSRRDLRGRRIVPRRLAEKFGLLPWRASSLVLTGWATAVGVGRRRRGAPDRRRNRQCHGGRPAAAILSRPGGRSAAGRRPAGGRSRSSRPRHRRDRRTRRRVLSAGNLSPARRMPAGARPRQQGRGAAGLCDRARHRQPPRRESSSSAAPKRRLQSFPADGA